MIGLAVIGMFVAVILLGAIGWVLSVSAETPDIDGLDAVDKGSSSELLAADGSRLGYIQSDEIRTPVSSKRIPDALRHATVAIEDERFYSHGGVDLPGIARAAVRNVEAGETREGGSTITQQLVRNLYIDDNSRNISRKIREATLAEDLEGVHSKNWIINKYLNTVSYGTVLGRTAVGAEAAAQTYFSKPARKLKLTEAATLAGLPQAPSQYNPFQNPTAAIERRNEVLLKMADLGYISTAKAEKAIQAGLGLKQGDKYTNIREPFFFDYVKEELIRRYGVNNVRKGGLRVKTTIDPKLQKEGRKAIDGILNQGGDPSSAVVAIDPKTGFVRAMASSGRYKHKQFNLAAQGKRQPGSSFKTMALLTAVRQKANPETTTYVSKPFVANLPGYGEWKVSTYDNTYRGSISLAKATLSSDNAVYAQLALDVGPDNVAKTAKMMGITSELESVPSETLGGLGQGVSPLEMANAYATLASGGVRNKPIAIRSVRFPDGRTEEIGKPKRKRVFTDAEAYAVTKILEQNVQQGTGTKAQIGCPAAGKTGTTDNFNDAWFVGYTPNLATGVWVGYPKALQPMRGIHGIDVAGGTFPAEIWGRFMNQAKRGECNGFSRPSSGVQWQPFNGKYAKSGGGAASIDPKTGKPTAGKGKTGGAGSNSAGGDDYEGYDPRLYAPGVQR
ncbi:MAG: transglycosylase domain-containing protein [Solirubrobacterales bacterium]